MQEGCIHAHTQWGRTMHRDEAHAEPVELKLYSSGAILGGCIVVSSSCILFGELKVHLCECLEWR